MLKLGKGRTGAAAQPLKEPVKSILKRRIEKGLFFDPESTFPFYAQAIMLVRIIATMVFDQNESVRGVIPEQVRSKLLALEYQIHEGPNKTKKPECLNPFLNMFGFGIDEVTMITW